MKLTSFLYRNVIYPMIFFVKGLDVVSKVKKLEKIDNCNFADSDEIQQLKYTDIINIACNESDHYKQIIGSVSNFDPNLGSITSLPILTKEILRGKDPKQIKTECKKYVSRMTAGTTGTPVTVFVDKNALSWQLATRYFLFGWHGINIGDREARFWGRPLQGLGYAIKDLLLNRKRFSFCGSTKAELLHEYSVLLGYGPDYFYGYSSLILNAAMVCDENGLPRPKLKAIICTAELLGQLQKKYIEKVFGCPVIVEYGCTESDIIAFECEYGKLHVMSHNVFIEPNPVATGMVYTDLNNTAMPLIRYELGDNVEFETNGTCKCKRKLPIISHLEGRTIGQILTFPDGTTMHAVKFAYLIEDVASRGFDVVQFKIVYENSKLVFFVNMIGNTEQFEKSMRQGIDKLVNSKIAYSFKYGEIKSDMGKKFTYFENRI